MEYLKNCKREYSLSSLADDFKKKIKEKQDFIEMGIQLIQKPKEDNSCPFCEQDLQQDALDLIDNYTEYLNDIESTTIKLLKGNKSAIENSIERIEKINTDNIKTRIQIRSASLPKLLEQPYVQPLNLQAF